MSPPRREFLRTATAAAGAAALAPWILELEAAQTAALDDSKNTLADLALTTARQLGANYADIRLNRTSVESICTLYQQVHSFSREQTVGFVLRVLVKCTWGFAASSNVTGEEVRRVTRAAVDIARANSTFQRKPIRLAPAGKVVTNWKSSFEKDPFDVPLDGKIDFLLKVNAAAMKNPGASFVNSSMVWVSEQRFLATSDGSRIDQYLIRGMPSFNVTAVNRQTGDF